MRAPAEAADIEHVEVVEGPVRTGVTDPRDIVRYRLSQAQLAGFVAGLDDAVHRQVVQECVAAVAELGETSDQAVMLLAGRACPRRFVASAADRRIDLAPRIVCGGTRFRRDYPLVFAAASVRIAMPGWRPPGRASARCGRGGRLCRLGIGPCRESSPAVVRCSLSCTRGLSHWFGWSLNRLEILRRTLAVAGGDA